MQKEILLQLLQQNKMDCSHFCKKINTENTDFRLTKQTATVGFIYRHIGETINLIGEFFGYETNVVATTIGQKDTGVQYDLDVSKAYFEDGYTTFKKLVLHTTDHEWLEEIETPWFGNITRIRLFSIALFHNSHHCGQISSAILKGKK